MGIFDSILGGAGKILSNPTVQSGIGAGLDFYLNKRAGDKTQETINRMGTYNPYNVNTGFGSLVRDGNNLSFGGGSSDVLQGLGAQALAGYNPNPQAAAQQRYQMLTDLALPQENRNFNRLKDNLFASGRAGTTGGLVTGDDSLRAFQEASNTADLQRQMAGQDFARQQNQDLYNQGTGFLQNAFAPFGNIANASINAGSPNTAAGVVGNLGTISNQNASQYGAIGNVAGGLLQSGFDWLNKNQAAPAPLGYGSGAGVQPSNQQYQYLQRPI